MRQWRFPALLFGLLVACGLAPAQQAPAIYHVAYHTTSGDFTLAVHRDWAPRGADRFYQLVASHYYDGNAFYRVVAGFVAQWGLSPDPAVTARWLHAAIPDDPVTHSNLAGTISFAASGKNTRTAEVFVNLRDNKRLDKIGFAPFGQVDSGLSVVRGLASDYGDVPPGGHGPDPRLIILAGAAYLTHYFPRLDVIYTCRLVP